MKKLFFAVFCGVLVVSLTGCGGGDDKDGGSSNVNVTGSWSGTLHYHNVTLDTQWDESVSIQFVQTDSTLTGTYTESGETSSLSGSVSGSAISFTRSGITYSGTTDLTTMSLTAYTSNSSGAESFELSLTLTKVS
jgi:uncharacterized lipoprotein YehR (DUF1307 family)